MVDNGICMRCSLTALAKVLDQFSGIEHYAGIAVGLHLQKLWINLAESSAELALERRFGRLNGAKLALERRFGWPDRVKLVLERRLSRPNGAKLASTMMSNSTSPASISMTLWTFRRCQPIAPTLMFTST